MEVRQLEVFLAVAEQLHFARAAEQLFMAPAPLSRTISALESELGTRLFERSTRSVSLTPAGQALIDPAREVMRVVTRAKETVSAVMDGEAGVVRVEFAGVAAHPIVAALARRMRAEHPDIRVELSSQPISRPAMHNLVNEETDIALGRWDQCPPGVETRVLMRDSLVIAVPRTHRLAGAERVGFADVAHEPFVALPYSGGSITTDRLWRLAYAHHASVDRVQFAPDTHSCIALVSAGVGCHLALGSVARWMANPDVAFVDLASDDAAQVPDVHLRVAWRQSVGQAATGIALEYLSIDADSGAPTQVGAGALQQAQ